MHSFYYNGGVWYDNLGKPRTSVRDSFDKITFLPDMNISADVRTAKDLKNNVLNPDIYRGSIFLAGPTDRNTLHTPWREQAISYLWESGFDGNVFVPEFLDHKLDTDYRDIVDWEQLHLNNVTWILFWIPRDIGGGMPAFTTNVEFGRFYREPNVSVGAPMDADKVRYLARLWDLEDKFSPWMTDLYSLVQQVMKHVYDNSPA